MGFFMTDASFDQKTKIANIAILDLKTQEKYTKSLYKPNVKEAEKTGIIEALHYGKKYKNIIVFCDNVFAVNETRKEVLSSPYWQHMYRYIQIVWIPREETEIADFFSKNIENPDDIYNNKLKAWKEHTKTYSIMDIVLSDKDKLNVVKQILNNLNIKTNNKTLKQIMYEDLDELKVKPNELHELEETYKMLLVKTENVDKLNQAFTMIFDTIKTL